MSMGLPIGIKKDSFTTFKRGFLSHKGKPIELKSLNHQQHSKGGGKQLLVERKQSPNPVTPTRDALRDFTSLSVHPNQI